MQVCVDVGASYGVVKAGGKICYDFAVGFKCSSGTCQRCKYYVCGMLGKKTWRCTTTINSYPGGSSSYTRTYTRTATKFDGVTKRCKKNEQCHPQCCGLTETEAANVNRRFLADVVDGARGLQGSNGNEEPIGNEGSYVSLVGSGYWDEYLVGATFSSSDPDDVIEACINYDELDNEGDVTFTGYPYMLFNSSSIGSLGCPSFT